MRLNITRKHVIARIDTIRHALYEPLSLSIPTAQGHGPASEDRGISRKCGDTLGRLRPHPVPVGALGVGTCQFDSRNYM